jgi:hypothetical protein
VATPPGLYSGSSRTRPGRGDHLLGMGSGVNAVATAEGTDSISVMEDSMMDGSLTEGRGEVGSETALEVPVLSLLLVSVVEEGASVVVVVVVVDVVVDASVEVS